jgi:hypothetical protein
MTSRERLVAVLRGGEPDRIPWSPCMDSYFTDSVLIGGKHPDLADAARHMDADHMERHVQVANHKMENVQYELFAKGNEEMERFTTPVGKLEQVYSFSGYTRCYKGHMVSTLEDMKVLKFIIENSHYFHNPTYFLEREAYIGDDGLATTTANTTPIKFLMEFYTGLQNFAYLLYDYESEMNELMEIIHQKNLELLRIIIDSPAEFIFSYEDTSTTVLSDKWYSKYCINPIDEYADMVHKAGKVFITHMCGKLKGFIGLISQGRMDGIDSVCPPATGDLWANEALKTLPGKIVIGGIEPAALQRMTVDETEAYTTAVLESVAPGKRFILSTGDSVAWGTPMDNMKKVGETVARYGKYPIH